MRGEDCGYQADDYVSGYVSLANAPVTLLLKRGGGVVATVYARSGSDGYYWGRFADAYGNAAPILAGDRVEATCGGQTTAVDVPAFAVTSDPVNDRGHRHDQCERHHLHRGYGRAPWPCGPLPLLIGAMASTFCQASGAFDASNPFYHYADPANGDETLDWAPGAVGHLRYIDAASNRVYARFQAADPGSKPVIYVRGDYWNGYYTSENYVSGNVSGFCGNGVITLKGSGGTLKAQATNYMRLLVWRQPVRRLRQCDADSGGGQSGGPPSAVRPR